MFVPGHFDAPTVSQLVDAFGHGRLSVIGTPGGPSPHELAALGVARVSYGPYPQRLAPKAPSDHAAVLLSGRGLPDNPTTRQANRPLPANASRRAGADRSPMSPHPYRGPLTDDSPLKSAPSGTSAPVVEKAVVG